MRASSAGALLLFLLVGLPGRAEDKVEVKVVKYDGLTDTIRQAHGKVVVIDFWSVY